MQEIFMAIYTCLLKLERKIVKEQNDHVKL